MDRLVRAAAAMTSSSRAFPGGALEEMGMGGGGVGRAQEVLQARPRPGTRAGLGTCVHPAPSLQEPGRRPSSTSSSGCRAPNPQEPPGTGLGWGLSKARLLCSLGFVPPWLLQTLLLDRSLRPSRWGQARPGPAQPSPQSHINQGCATAAAGLAPDPGGREQPAVSSSPGRLGSKHKRVPGPQRARPEPAPACAASPGCQAPGRVSLSADRAGETAIGGPGMPGRSIPRGPHSLLGTEADRRPLPVLRSGPQGLERNKAY